MTGAKAVTALYPAASELDLLRRKVYYLADRAAKTLRMSPSIPLDEGLPVGRLVPTTWHRLATDSDSETCAVVLWPNSEIPPNRQQPANLTRALP